MDILFYELSVLMQGNHSTNELLNSSSFYFSDFVATRILHKLYESCCEKRFRPYKVKEIESAPRTTLYKYLIPPKDKQLPSEQPISNLLAPRSLPRSSSNNDPLSETSRSFSRSQHEIRSRSGTLPFITPNTGSEQQLIKRSQSRPQYDDEV
jgi:hypothetical protein